MGIYQQVLGWLISKCFRVTGGILFGLAVFSKDYYRTRLYNPVPEQFSTILKTNLLPYRAAPFPRVASHLSNKLLPFFLFSAFDFIAQIVYAFTQRDVRCQATWSSKLSVLHPSSAVASR